MAIFILGSTSSTIAKGQNLKSLTCAKSVLLLAASAFLRQWSTRLLFITSWKPKIATSEPGTWAAWQLLTSLLSTPSRSQSGTNSKTSISTLRTLQSQWLCQTSLMESPRGKYWLSRSSWSEKFWIESTSFLRSSRPNLHCHQCGTEILGSQASNSVSTTKKFSHCSFSVVS